MADAVIEGRQGEDEDVTEDSFKDNKDAKKSVDSLEDIVEAVEGDNDAKSDK